MLERAAALGKRGEGGGGRFGVKLAVALENDANIQAPRPRQKPWTTSLERSV